MIELERKKTNQDFDFGDVTLEMPIRYPSRFIELNRGILREFVSEYLTLGVFSDP